MKSPLFPVSIFLLTLLQVGGQETPEPVCNNDTCAPPDCYCPSPRIPNGFKASEIPQFILFSFNGPVTAQHGDYVKLIFNRTRRNPNGTPIRATFFVSDDREKTDYCTVHNLWAYSHEIGSFSVIRQSARFWATARQSDWEREIDNQKEYLVGNASIDADHVLGFRSPQLQTGGDEQYRFAIDRQYTYDSSIVLPILKQRIWPYTMDFPTEYECYAPPCPTGNFPGLWQIPVQPLVGRGGKRCNYLEKCLNRPVYAQNVFEILNETFYKSFDTENGNRAPMMVNLLDYKELFDDYPAALEGIISFIDMVLSNRGDDVWFVTYNDLIGWMKEPTNLVTIKYFAPLSRMKREREECEERRGRLPLDGRALIIVEIIVCIIGYIYLYVKEQNE